ncbi:hypothetical protein EI77_00564 [Prosthecobacter fusiformis]|uniref:Uncharacterized protein n=1 Tax=Prosthecobacter fusiformis TaxID=48464 RepID=A0A4R7SQG3_9BACT|nr:hypothetical protein [Prosthecobacter fusiformis]TDU81261.1 hypothetical protein EI77_00564 [Prosthecobacter fusiformis]
MSTNPQEPDFNHRLLRWLDGTASPEEAAQLWKEVGDSPDCARELAAQARFESLIEANVKARAGERAESLRLKAFNAQRAKPKAWSRSWSRRVMAMAALLMLGMVCWSFWPDTKGSPQMAKKEVLPQVKKQRVKLPGVAVQAPVVAQAALPERSLPERLDAFILPQVSLRQVTLREALGLLQGQMLELNHLKSESLEKLRVTLPVDAAQRKITFESGPISFWKAMRAVAALGGCDLSVDEAGLALILHREIYPQQPERRQLRSLLAGLTTTGGKAAWEDPGRMAGLVADAGSLGIIGDISGDEELPVTRGQWEALQMLTEAREQRLTPLTPGFLIYMVEEGSEQTDRLLTEEEVEQIRAQNVPAAMEIPPGQFRIPLGGQKAEDDMIVEIQQEGDVLRFSSGSGNLYAGTSAIPSQPSNVVGNMSPSLVVGPGQGGLITLHSQNNGVITGSVSNVIGGGSTQIIVVPVPASP